MALGIVMVGCGSMIWPYFFSFVVGVGGACFVLYEDQTIPKLAPGLPGDVVLALQAGVTLFLAVYLGFEGSQVILGSMIGLASAYVADVTVLHLQDVSPYASFGLSCFGAAFGVIVFHGYCRQSILATMSPLFGGLLFVTGAGTVLAQFGILPFLSPQLVWIDATKALFGSAGATHLVVQGICAILSSIIASLGGANRVNVAVIPMGLGLSLGTFASATGLGCGLLHNCPPWLSPAANPAWPLLGGLAWTAAACSGAILQLRNVASTSYEELLRKERSATRARKGTTAAANTSSYGYPETQGLLTQPHLYPDDHNNSSSNPYGGSHADFGTASNNRSNSNSPSRSNLRIPGM